MPLITYKSKNFGEAALDIIEKANQVLDAYLVEGYDLTLRQLYYQFVSRDWIANKDSEYKRLGNIIGDARLAGLIDWDRIVDRGRYLRSLPNWNSPASIIRSAVSSFQIDKWANQPYYLEVWVEKDALVGVMERACEPLDVPYFSCRGYTSATEMWGCAQRLGEKLAEGKDVRILHLGDHDPSGIDMTRDIDDRLWMFIFNDYVMGRHIDGDDFYERTRWRDTDDDGERRELLREMRVEVENRIGVDRLALNMDQVVQYAPPPNPAKITDSRAKGYIATHGQSSWELDALPPTVLGDLIRAQVGSYLDHDQWDEDLEREQDMKVALELTSKYWADVTTFVKEKENGNG